MNDLTTLREAFAELERQADEYPVHDADADVLRPTPRQRPMLLVAASVIVVAAVAIGVALFAGGSGGDGAGPRHLQVGAPTTPRPTNSTPMPTEVTRSGSLTWIPARPVLISPPAGNVSRQRRSAVISQVEAVDMARAAEPRNAAQLAARLRKILGGTATFTYTTPGGSSTPYIVGTMTRTRDGAVGGFDIQINPGSPTDTAFCEDADTSHCRIRRLPDGSSLATGHESLQGGGTLYLVDLVRHVTGSNVLMHVSNNSNPKGGGTVANNAPPLSVAEIVEVLDSPKWG